VCVCVCVRVYLSHRHVCTYPTDKKEGLRSVRQTAKKTKKNKKKGLTTREAGSYLVFGVEGFKRVCGLWFRPKSCTCPKKEQRAFEGRC
jgi:hypothetical protein